MYGKRWPKCGLEDQFNPKYIARILNEIDLHPEYTIDQIATVCRKPGRLDRKKFDAIVEALLGLVYPPIIHDTHVACGLILTQWGDPLLRDYRGHLGWTVAFNEQRYGYRELEPLPDDTTPLPVPYNKQWVALILQHFALNPGTTLGAAYRLAEGNKPAPQWPSLPKAIETVHALEAATPPLLEVRARTCVPRQAFKIDRSVPYRDPWGYRQERPRIAVEGAPDRRSRPLHVTPAGAEILATLSHYLPQD
jgi:hypothetical protein